MRSFKALLLTVAMLLGCAQAQRFNYSPTDFGVNGVTLPPVLVTPVNAAFTQGAGTLGAATYFYRVSAIDGQGETLASTETSVAIAAAHGVNVNWGAVTGATGYKIYGRTTGAELLIATVGAVTTFLDDGSITPAGVLPAANTTGRTAPSTIIPGAKDSVRIRALTLASNCTQVGSIYVNVYDEAGAAVVGTFQLFSAVAVGVQQFYIGTELTPNATSGTPVAPLRLPENAVSFFFANAGAVAGTCTQRLVISY